MILDSLEVLLRTAVLAVGLGVSGYAVFPRQTAFRTERVLLGFLLHFHSLLACALLQRAGVAPSAYLTGGAMLTILAGGIWNLRAQCRACPRTTFTGSHAKWLVPLCVLGAGLILGADWPRVLPLSTDADQHAWFLKEFIRFGGVPFHQGNVGPLPLQYPVGTGATAYVVSAVIGRSWAPIVTGVLPALFVLWMLAYLWESGKNGPARAVAILSFLCLGLGVTGFARNHENLGRVLQTPIFIYLITLAVGGAPFRNGLRVILPLVGTYLLSLNPTTAPISLALLLLVAVHYRGEINLGFLKWVLPAALLGLVLVLAGDPYFGALLGIDPPLWESVSARSVTDDSVLLSPLEILRSYSPAHYFGLIRDFFRNALPARGSFAFVAVVIAAIWGLLRTRATLSNLMRAWGVFTVAYVISQMTSVEWLGSKLLRAYTQDHLQLLAQWSLYFASLGLLPEWRRHWDAGRRGRACLAALAGIVLALPALLKAGNTVEWYGHRHRFRFWELNSPDENRVRDALAELWREEPGTRVLFENFELDHLSDENWISPVFPLAYFAYLPAANPAFFYFQGEPYYRRADYRERVCREVDVAWLRERGIRYLLLGPAGPRRCPGLDALRGTDQLTLRKLSEL